MSPHNYTGYFSPSNSEWVGVTWWVNTFSACAFHIRLDETVYLLSGWVLRLCGRNLTDVRQIHQVLIGPPPPPPRPSPPSAIRGVRTSSKKNSPRASPPSAIRGVRTSAKAQSLSPKRERSAWSFSEEKSQRKTQEPTSVHC